MQLAAPPGCEAEARRFFGGILGLVELEEPEPLHVGVEEAFAPAGNAHAAFRVAAAELGRLAEALAAAGAPVRWDGSLPDARRFYTSDPWGNRLELLAPA